MTRRKYVTPVLLTFALCAAFAQAPPKAQPQPTSPPPQPPPAEHRITPQEARELLGAVDRVLQFDSKATALPIRHEVKRRLADREQVQKYIEDRFREDEDTQRLKKGGVVLKKLGLLPRDFDIESFLVQLLKEQVAGYYDPKSKTVNLLDWLPADTQIPVLAHELTHALQDQNYGLESWVRGGVSGKKPADEVASDEELAARHAVIEGQAMAVMIDWMLAPTGQSIVTTPMIAQAIEAGMAQAGGSPVFQKAPLYLQRTLLFPYSYGLDFVRELLARGKDRAFAGVFQRPPENTRQVMEPAVYLAGEKLTPLSPPADLDKIIGPDWQKYDVGSIGEFDIEVMAEQFGSIQQARKIFPNWRGGYYYTVNGKNAKAGDPATLGLIFVTRWASPDAAHDFAVLYYNTIPNKRYTITRSLGSNPPMWSTTEGAVSLAEQGDVVIAIESLDADLHQRIRDAVLKTASPAPAPHE